MIFPSFSRSFIVDNFSNNGFPIPFRFNGTKPLSPEHQLSFGCVLPLGPNANRKNKARFSSCRDLPRSAPIFGTLPGTKPLVSLSYNKFQILGIPTPIDNGPSAISAVVWRNETTGIALVFDRCDKDLRKHLLHWHRTTGHLLLLTEHADTGMDNCLYLESNKDIANELRSPIPAGYHPHPLRLLMATQGLESRPEMRGITLFRLLAGSEKEFEKAKLACGPLLDHRNA